MLCEEILRSDVEGLRPEDTAQAAAHRMRQYNIGFLPICQQGKVLGSLSDRNIATRIVADNRPVTTPVVDLMTAEPVSCRPSDDVTLAERLMQDHDKLHLVCLNDRGDFAGIISMVDILAARRGQSTEFDLHPGDLRVN